MVGGTKVYPSENEVLKELKQTLARYEKLIIENEDLTDTGLNQALFSEDLYLIRSKKDRLVYIFDEDDTSETLLDMEDIQIIINNAVSRIMEHNQLVRELDNFFADVE